MQLNLKENLKTRTMPNCGFVLDFGLKYILLIKTNQVPVLIQYPQENLCVFFYM